MFGPDGTQAPPPPRFFPDPLAGLIAADTFVPSFPRKALPKITAPPAPPQPTEQMRRAVADQMAREQRHVARPVQRQRAPQRPHVPPAMPAVVPPAAAVSQAQQQQQQTSGAATFVGCLILLMIFGGLLVGVIAFLGALFS